MNDSLPSIGAEVERRTRGPGIPVHGIAYAQLADRHRRITECCEIASKGRRVPCSTCRGT
jgi:hypothetical protein